MAGESRKRFGDEEERSAHRRRRVIDIREKRSQDDSPEAGEGWDEVAESPAQAEMPNTTCERAIILWSLTLDQEVSKYLECILFLDDRQGLVRVGAAAGRRIRRGSRSEVDGGSLI